MLLCDIKKEEILSHKLLKLNEDAVGIYEYAYTLLRYHLDYKSVLAEYRNLRISIENNRTYEEASNLYKMEMKLKLRYYGLPEKIALFIYWIISDFGESIGRAIFWIIVAIFSIPLIALIKEYGLTPQVLEFYKIKFEELIFDTITAFFQLSIEKNHFMKNWEVVIRIASLLLLGNLYIAVRRKLSRK